MRVGVDAGCLGVKSSQKFGVYRMAKELLSALAKIDKANEYILYSFLPIEKEILKLSTKFTNRIVRPARGWHYLALPLAVWQDQIEVFLGLSQALPAFCRCRKIVMIHYLGFAIKPQYYPSSGRLVRITQAAIKRTDKIIAVSQTTKRDLQRIYGVKSQKIKVIYEGVNQEVFYAKEKND